MKRLIACAMLATVTLLMPASARAVPLMGQFSIAGLADVRVGPDYIDWGQLGNIFGPANGDILFTGGNGDFMGIGGTQGTIEDLDSTNNPVGVPFVDDNFLTAATQPSWNFSLRYIFPGSGTAAGCTNVAGDVCTPFGSPFTITNLNGGGASVALRLSGVVSDGSGDPASNFTGAFTTQFTTLTAADLLAQIASLGYVQSSHSANFDVNVTAVPEPATLALLGGGLSAFAFLRRRRQPRD